MSYLQGWLVIGLLSSINSNVSDTRLMEYGWGIAALLAFAFAIAISFLDRNPR